MFNSCWRIFHPNNNTFFDIDIKNKKNAKLLCNYYSQRDSRPYIIKKWYYLLGLPNY